MAKGKVEEITLPVAGMSCAACVNKVEKVLKGLPGVADAKVNLAAGQGGRGVRPRRLQPHGHGGSHPGHRL